MPPGDEETPVTSAPRTDGPRLRSPSASDGTRMWELARDSRSLDVNSRYAYVLWCRDFAATSVIAVDGPTTAGYLTGYRRPEAPDTFFVWQVAVADTHRRRGLARRMLDHAANGDGGRPRFVEATVTPDNVASARLFTTFADDNDAPLTRVELFDATTLGGGHEPEILYRIGPLGDHQGLSRHPADRLRRPEDASHDPR